MKFLLFLHVPFYFHTVYQHEFTFKFQNKTYFLLCSGMQWTKKNLTPVNKCGNPKYQMLSLNQACGDEFRNSHTKLILEV